MPSSISTWRRAFRQAAQEAVGLEDYPRQTALQREILGREADIWRLPENLEGATYLQDTNPSSPTFGLPKFMLGYDGLGNAPL